MAEREMIYADLDPKFQVSVYKTYYPVSDGEVQSYYTHMHSELEISCVMRGSGIYTLGDTDYAFRPGDIFFHGGNENHYMKRIDPGENLSILGIRFAPRLLWSAGGQWIDTGFLRIFLTPEKKSRSIPHTAAPAAEIYALLSGIFDECREKAPAYELQVKAKLLTILADAARYFYPELGGKGLSAACAAHLADIEVVMDHIRQHLSEPLSLDELARMATMSRSQFSALFRELNGVSAWDYITMQRISLAQYQLEHTALPVTQIAENSGYNNISNFNRTFRRLTGQTPRQFRQDAGKK